MKRREIPKFESEAEEADWWYRQRETTARWMEDAVAAGKTTTLAKVLERARQRAASEPSASIHINAADMARARSLATRRGLPYHTYLKRLLREALDREERGVAP